MYVRLITYIQQQYVIYKYSYGR